MKKKTGFALLTPEQRKEMGRKAGLKSSEGGKAHRFTPEEASEAGKRGSDARFKRKPRKVAKKSRIIG